MPRRNVPLRRRAGQFPEPAPRGTTLNERTDSWRGIDYRVRSLSGSASSGPYRCPGCDQLLTVATPHVVAWPAHDIDAEDRRHWHTSCWAGRDRRQPGVQRSRNAPRYS